MTRSVKILVGVTAALIALIVLVALSSLGLYYFFNAQEAYTLAAEGYRAAAAGNYDVAIARYSAALQKAVLNQQKALLYTNRGAAYNSKRQFDQAISDHTNAIRLNSHLSYAYASRGWAYTQRCQLEEASMDLTEAIRLDPNSESAYYDRGLVLAGRRCRRPLSESLSRLHVMTRGKVLSPSSLAVKRFNFLTKRDFGRYRPPLAMVYRRLPQQRCRPLDLRSRH